MVWFARMRGAIGRSTGLMLLLVVSVPSVDAKQDPIDEDWWIGNLTWKDGVGGISTDANAPTTEYGGHGAPDGLPASDIFTSAPLPAPIYLDPAKDVQLDIIHQGTWSLCNVADIRIDVD